MNIKHGPKIPGQVTVIQRETYNHTRGSRSVLRECIVFSVRPYDHTRTLTRSLGNQGCATLKIRLQALFEGTLRFVFSAGRVEQSGRGGGLQISLWVADDATMKVM